VRDDEARRLGIQRDYLDNADRPARLGERTVEALRSALGEPPPGLDERAPVVRRVGTALDVPGADGVTLEDGTQLEVTGAQRLPTGYHWLHTSTGERRRLIVSPGACVLPTDRQWGWTAQLYAARSRTSWGLGDFADLARLTALTRRQGGGFVLVNPLHAGGPATPDRPQQPSPYFPSSRRFLSPLYLAVEQVPGAEELGDDLASAVAAGQSLNRTRDIDRDAVWRHKHAALRAIFDRTAAHTAAEFAAWRAGRGAALDEFATWSVLAARYDTSWPDWLAGARHPDGPLARAVADEAPDELAFVAWLQWQAETQLRAASQDVRVIQDLPIGVDPAGADAWAYQDALALDATVGAPPDPFNRAGQDWGLPPFVPWQLRAADYQPFIDAVRATIALAGGLRIDHVMGLFRLWWIPAGFTADQGGYVRYPADDLLDIVALESARAGAPVVGEDLGTVEPGVRERLAARNVLSYRLLWFEPDPPRTWPTHSLAAIGTHDLPTVAGMWTGSDLARQRAAGLEPDAEATDRLRRLLVETAGVAPDAPPAEAIAGAYRLLADAPSRLRAAALDDALAESVRPNIPGTDRSANWCRALPVPLDDLDQQPGVQRIADLLR
jgi:4-alpha-glucanotransferase